MNTKTHGVMLAILVLAVVGCGSKDQVIVGSNGEKATISQDGSSTTITGPKGEKWTASNDGKVIEGKDDKGNSYSLNANITEADLGVPFYPGSTESPAGSVKSETGDSKNIVSMRTTTDDPEKVTEFYKEKVQDPKPSSSSIGDTKTALLQGKLPDGSAVTISAVKSGSEPTQITVGVTLKKS